jgi:hypothetical protein
LAIEIQLGRVLQAQHYRMLTHALLRLDGMWLQYTFPIRILIAQKSVCRYGVGPSPGGYWNAGCWFVRKLFHQLDRPLVEPFVTSPFKVLSI